MVTLIIIGICVALYISAVIVVAKLKSEDSFLTRERGEIIGSGHRKKN